MFDKQIILLYFLLFSITTSSLFADKIHDESYPEKKVAAEKQFDSLQKSQPLNLEVDPNFIEESEKQQNAINEKNVQVFSNVFKDQRGEKDVSMGSGVLLKNESISPEAIDGAEISIKVKTN
ncbi:MAG: hypothetical protein QNL62_09400 [Gammaproteobacteria bacterium]|nr:hypothetical protein [Gammaproteobacteria bacterium]